MSSVVKPLSRFALLGLAVGALVFAAAPGALAGSAAATASADNVPCWKQLLNDWYDGTINKTYPIACYNQAIHHLPPDLQIYSSAKDDIQRARAAAIAGQKPPPESSKPPAGGTTTTGTGKASKHGLKKFLDEITPGNADSFPLPLLILGALAILLVIAGAVGMLWQRSNPPDEPPPAA